MVHPKSLLWPYHFMTDNDFPPVLLLSLQTFHIKRSQHTYTNRETSLAFLNKNKNLRMLFKVDISEILIKRHLVSII